MVKRIPLDIESILEIGVDEWFESFDWTFSWDEFIELEDKVKEVLKKNINDHPLLAEIIVINYKIYIEYANFILALILKNNLGNKALISDKNIYYKGMFNNGAPPQPIVQFPSLVPRKGFRAKLSRIKRFIIDNKYSFSFKKDNSAFILNESRNIHTIEYLQKEYLGNIYPVSFFDYYSNNSKVEVSIKDKKELETLVNSVINQISELSKRYRIDLNRDQIKFLKEHTFALFYETKQVLETVKRAVGKKKIKLFIGANNSYYSRILSVAIRDAGGEVHGFKHGEPMNYMYDLVSWLDLSLNDYFYEYTSENMKMLHNISREFPPLNGNNCEIRSMDSSKYNNLFRENSNEKISAKNEKVVLIGNSFRHTSFSSATAVFPSLQLYLELSILKEMKKEFSEVAYKLHPESLTDRKGYIENEEVIKKLFPKGIEIISKNFEEVVNEFDTVLFYYTGTSVFGAALEKNLSTIIFDVGIRSYPADILDYLKKNTDYRLVKSRFIKSRI